MDLSVQKLQEDVKQYSSANACLRSEIQQLKQNVEVLEQERQTSRAQREQLQEELNCVQAMCSNLKVANSNLCQQLDAKDEEVAEIQADKRDLMCKLDYLCNQWQLERSRIKELKERLGNRQHHTVTQASIEELALGLKAAQKHLNIAQKKLDKLCESLMSINQMQAQEIIPCGSEDKVLPSDTKWMPPGPEQSSFLFGEDPFMQQIEVLMSMLSKFAQRTSAQHKTRVKSVKHVHKMALKDKEDNFVANSDNSTNSVIKCSSAVVHKTHPPLCLDSETVHRANFSSQDIASNSTCDVTSDSDKKVGSSKSAATLS